mgnify:CR=1 FL=1
MTKLFGFHPALNSTDSSNDWARARAREGQRGDGVGRDERADRDDCRLLRCEREHRRGAQSGGQCARGIPARVPMAAAGTAAAHTAAGSVTPAWLS